MKTCPKCEADMSKRESFEGGQEWKCVNCPCRMSVRAYKQRSGVTKAQRRAIESVIDFVASDGLEVKVRTESLRPDGKVTLAVVTGKTGAESAGAMLLRRHMRLVIGRRGGLVATTDDGEVSGSRALVLGFRQ